MIISNWVEKKLDENLRKSREAREVKIRETRNRMYEKNYQEGFKQGYQEGFEQGRAYERERIAAETNGLASDDLPRENNR